MISWYLAARSVRLVSGTIALFFVGVWLGESLRIASVTTAAILALLWFGGVTYEVRSELRLPRAHLGSRLLLGSAVVTWLIAIGVGWSTGGNGANRAFNECVDSGEAVRAKLEEYRAENGEFPAELEEVYAGAVPCSRVMRGTILQYQRRPGGYSMSFGDWLVIHSSTDEEGFLALKN